MISCGACRLQCWAACRTQEPCESQLHSVTGSDAQIVRLSSQDVPTAYAYELEAATIVQPEQVQDAVRRVVGSRALAYA